MLLWILLVESLSYSSWWLGISGPEGDVTVEPSVRRCKPARPCWSWEGSARRRRSADASTGDAAPSCVQNMICKWIVGRHTRPQRSPSSVAQWAGRRSTRLFWMPWRSLQGRRLDSTIDARVSAAAQLEMARVVLSPAEHIGSDIGRMKI